MRLRFRDRGVQRDFDREGYAVVALLDGELPALMQTAAEVEASLRTDPRWEPRGFEELMYVEDRGWRHALQSRIESLLLPRLEAHLEHPRVVVSNLLVKAAAPATNDVPLHQDFCIVDESLGFEHLQLWVPLVDVDERNGCMRVLPRSNRAPHPYRAQDDRTPYDGYLDKLVPRMRPIPLRAGQALLFSGRTVHASERNRSDRARPAVGCMVTGSSAPLVHYHRLDARHVEAFSLEPEDLRVLVPGRRPDVGRAVGVIEHGPSAVSYEEFLRLSADDA